jgi:putative colanic acid biosynthesis UDP-glucose lipid carrier transferase
MALSGMKKAVTGGATQVDRRHSRKPWSDSKRSVLLPTASLDRQGATFLDPASVTLIQWLLCPLVIVVSLAVCVLYYGQDFNEDFLALAIVSFLLATHIFDEANLYRQQPRFPLTHALYDTLLKWALTVACLWVLAVLFNMGDQFPRKPLLAWVAVTPLVLLLAKLLTRQALQAFVAQGRQRTAIIIGANLLGYELFNQINSDAYLGVEVRGFFDDRAQVRLPPAMHDRVMGPMDAVAAYVREQNIDLVYISLPMLPHPRILNLLDGLRDSTASVYFVPDMFMFDLINARFDRVNGVPVVSIRDTPYFGVGGLVKRLSDIVISSLILLLIFPVMALIAVGVKLSSRGPVLFKQRRYGLDGDEIRVFKFRSMTVTEDGDRVVQAKKNDQRVTPFGKFLRASSLDELPQFINVLQGRMSIVGPRPHAVSHNEMYRKVISGYMIRHKVKPGITGWAQVNGLRGETETLEKMAERVEYDLEYIRNWSLMLDLWIILRTVKVVFVKDENAF